MTNWTTTHFLNGDEENGESVPVLQVRLSVSSSPTGFYVEFSGFLTHRGRTFDATEAYVELHVMALSYTTGYD